MDTIQRQVADILDRAESSLSDLVHNALLQKNYEDVAFVAEALSRMTQVRQELQLPELRLSSRGQSLVVPISDSGHGTGEVSSLSAIKSRSRPKAIGDSGHSTRAKASKYPLFLRDDSRLIKVGWSKKKNDEYMHRVPEGVVLAFAKHLERSVGVGSLFEIESLFPVLTASGEEVPGYQIYVIVAWLREAGVIERKGRDGYVIQDKSKLRGNFHELWESIQTLAN